MHGLISFRFTCAILFLLQVCLPACQALKSSDAMGQLLYVEKFNLDGGEWRIHADGKGQAGFIDGVFSILVTEENSDVLATPGLNLGDVRIETEAFKVDGDRNNRFGVLCRYSHESSFYLFLISSDGYYGIGKIKGTTYQLLGAQSLLPSDQIPEGSQYLKIRADCIKDVLSLYVNGQLIHQIQDGEFINGDVGIIAGTYDNPGIEILFDNFAVYSP